MAMLYRFIALALLTSCARAPAASSATGPSPQSTAFVPAEPLPAGASAVGSMYEVNAASRIEFPIDAPHEVALPVPQGTDPSTLAAAVRFAWAHVLDAPSTGHDWAIINGKYDAKRGVYLVPFYVLNAEPQILTLVNMPGREFHTVGQTNAPTRASAGAYTVECVGEGACEPAVLEEVGDLLTVATSELQALGYKPPRLAPGQEVRLITKEACTAEGMQARGWYSQEFLILNICVAPFATTLGLKRYTVVHELFHAYQAAYSLFTPGVSELFITEGTARSAEGSIATGNGDATKTARSPREQALHLIDVSLLSSESDYEYNAQDFWIYGTRAYGIDMDAWIPIFANGSSLAAVEKYGGQLADAYWAWVKNQAFEKIIDFDGRLPAPTCSRVEEAVSQKDLEWRWSAGVPVAPFVYALGPLQSALVTVKAVDGFPVNFRITEDAGTGDIRFKVYQEFDDQCELIPDGPREFNNGDQNIVYRVLISNVSSTLIEVARLQGEQL